MKKREIEKKLEDMAQFRVNNVQVPKGVFKEALHAGQRSK
jgi:hypothetical protein